MRSSLMIGLSLRLAKSSSEGGAPSFFADRTGDTMCDDGLFPRIIVISVFVVVCTNKIVVCEEEKVICGDENFVFLRRQKTKILLDFFPKKKALFTLSLFSRFKKSEQQQQQQQQQQQRER